MPLSKEKRDRIKAMMEGFLKSHGDVNQERIKIGFLNEDESLGRIEKLPTGIIGIDVLTNGGIIKGHINQVYGPEGSGKSTLFQEMVKTCQKKIDDFAAAYIGAEKSFDRVYASKIGVSEESIALMLGETAENNADFCIEATMTEAFDMIVFDTIQALASKNELYKKSESKNPELKSTEKDTMALLPRLFSQFLRMYTSRSVGKMTLILGSQVRLDLSSPAMHKPKKPTGGNAIAHYNLLTMKVQRLGDSSFPKMGTEIPPNSFAVQVTLDKAKFMDRYKGNSITIYFHKGSFEHKFNVLAIAKDLGLHDGKSLKYRLRNDTLDEAIASNSDWQEEEQEFKARGFNDMYSKVPPEAIAWLESQLVDVYTRKVMYYQQGEEDGEQD